MFSVIKYSRLKAFFSSFIKSKTGIDQIILENYIALIK